MTNFKSEDVQRVAERVFKFARTREKIKNVTIYYDNRSGFFSDSDLEMLVESLKTRGKIRQLDTVSLSILSVTTSGGAVFFGDALEKDGTKHSFVVKLKNGKVQKMDVDVIAEKLSKEIIASRIEISHSEIGDVIHGVLYFERNQNIDGVIKDLQKIKKSVMAVFKKEVLSKYPDAEPRMEELAFVNADHKQIQFSMGYWK